MTAERDLRDLLEARLRDVPPLRPTVLGDVLAQTQTIPQRRRWPLVAFDRPDSMPATNVAMSQRGFTMFSALKFIAASAIVALFGGSVLVGILATPQGDESAPAAETGSATPGDDASTAAQQLDEAVIETWNEGLPYQFQRLYAPDAVLTLSYFDGQESFEGPGRIAGVVSMADPGDRLERIAPITVVPAAEGELHWASVHDIDVQRYLWDGFKWQSMAVVGQGSVCSLWARDGKIVRHDCLVSGAAPTFATLWEADDEPPEGGDE